MNIRALPGLLFNMVMVVYSYIVLIYALYVLFSLFRYLCYRAAMDLHWWG